MKKIILAILSFTLFMSLAAPVYAVNPPIIPRPDSLPGPNQETLADPKATRGYFLENVIPNLDKGFIAFIAIVAVVMLIVGGIQLLTAYGDEEKIGTAKKTMTWAIVGLLLAMLSYAIVSIIVSLPLEKPQQPVGEEGTASQ